MNGNDKMRERVRKWIELVRRMGRENWVNRGRDGWENGVRGARKWREMGGRTERGMREWDRSGLRVIEWSEKGLRE